MAGCAESSTGRKLEQSLDAAALRVMGREALSDGNSFYSPNHRSYTRASLGLLHTIAGQGEMNQGDLLSALEVVRTKSIQQFLSKWERHEHLMWESYSSQHAHSHVGDSRFVESFECDTE